MPRPPGSKTGPDYTAIKQKLTRSGVQKENSSLYDSINDLVDAVSTFQGNIDDRYPQLDGSSSSLFNSMTDVINELNDRNNTKYCISLTNTASLILTSFEETIVSFDVDIYDDGLMHWEPTEIRLNNHGIWHFYGRIVFCTEATAEVKIFVNLNGIPQFMSAITSEGKIVLPFVGSFEALRNDIVTVSVYHNSQSPLALFASVQGHRISWVRNDKGPARNLAAGPLADDQVCLDNGLSGDAAECICGLENVAYAVMPFRLRTHLEDPDGKPISQFPTKSLLEIFYPDLTNTICARRNGNWFAAIDTTDDEDNEITRLEEWSSRGTKIGEVDLPIRIGQLATDPGSAYHCLLELPCDFILSYDVANNQVVELNGLTGQMSRIMSLEVDYLDACTNSKGNKLIYAQGTILGMYDLVNDGYLSEGYDFGFPIAWPTWLSDCSVLIANGGYLQNGDIIRIDPITNEELQRYSYDPALFPGGLIGYAASVDRDRLWIVGYAPTPTAPNAFIGYQIATIIMQLSDGALVFPNPVKWGWPGDMAAIPGFPTAMVTATYTPVDCGVESED